MASRLEKLSVETLVVPSEEDISVVNWEQSTTEYVPGASLEIIPAKSHWTHFAAPGKFLAAVDKSAN
ncbi:MAG: hypothetical protein QGG79_00125 [Dehalococcoidales bacterium]|nr:hypothetical protein [Dehalococcoidales bacterium]